jgi:hypothetical protein
MLISLEEKGEKGGEKEKMSRNPAILCFLDGVRGCLAKIV